MSVKRKVTVPDGRSEGIPALPTDDDGCPRPVRARSQRERVATGLRRHRKPEELGLRVPARAPEVPRHRLCVGRDADAQDRSVRGEFVPEEVDVAEPDGELARRWPNVPGEVLSREREAIVAGPLATCIPLDRVHRLLAEAPRDSLAVEAR